jgi:hypothetical protein
MIIFGGAQIFNTVILSLIIYFFILLLIFAKMKADTSPQLYETSIFRFFSMSVLYHPTPHPPPPPPCKRTKEGSQKMVFSTFGSAYPISERGSYNANNFRFMYYQKRISQNSFPNLIYIFPKSFLIFQKEQLNAAIPLSAFGGI